MERHKLSDMTTILNLLGCSEVENAHFSFQAK